MLRSHIRLVPPLLALLLAALMLAACGGTGGAGSGRSDEEQRLAFEDCLRDEGLDVESSPDGRTAARVMLRGGDRGRASFGGPDDKDSPFARCRDKTGWAPSPPTEEEQAEMRDRALKFARCMREHGVDVPDPRADGGMLMRVEEGEGPAMEAAQRACAQEGFGGPMPAGRAARGPR